MQIVWHIERILILRYTTSQLSHTFELNKRGRTSFLIVFFVLFIISALISPAWSDIRITRESKGETSIQKDLFLLEDPDGRFTIQDITQGSQNKNFIANKQAKTGFGYSDSVYWIKLTIHKEPENTLSWVLKHTYPHLDQIEFYSPTSDNAYTRIFTGDAYSFNERPVKNRFFIFPIDPTPAGTTYYLRLSSKGAISFPLSIIDMSAFQDQDHASQLATGLFFGALLIMVIYYLFFFIFIREKLYFYYAVHVLFIALHQIVWFGFGFEYIWSESPWLNNILDLVAGNGIFFFLGLFTMDYLRTRTLMPRLHYVLMGSTILIGAGFFIIFILERKLVLGLINNLQMAQILIILVVAITGCVKRNRQAYLFLLAWSFALCGALLLIGYRNNLLPEIPILSNSIQLGILMNILLVTLGLAQRINDMKESMERINRDFASQNTELRGAYTALESSEKKYRDLAELLPQTVFALDLEGNITYTNQQGHKATGYTIDEFNQGINIFELFRPQDQERIRSGMKKILSNRELRQSEFMLKKKDGTLMPIVQYSNVILDGDKPMGFRGVMLDITQRKKTEELMIQTEKMISVGGLAAGMAHEINNPLAGIIQTAQVIHNRLTKPIPANERLAKELGTSMEVITDFMENRKIIYYLESIQRAGKQAAKIIENMLSFARKSDSKKQESRIDEILDTAIELAQNDYDLKKKYDFKDIEILKEYNPDTPPVFCEKSKIQQVMFNLLKNASQAMSSWESMTAPPQNYHSTDNGS